MAASGNKFNQKSKTKPVVEVVPESLIGMIPSGINNLIYDYSFDATDVDQEEQSVWLKKEPEEKKSAKKKPTTSYTLHTFFGISSSRKQILSVVEYAGPLEQLESYIRQAHARNEPDLQATLMMAIAMAIRRLDFTIRNEEGIETDKGMTERLLELHAELFPQDQAKALELANSATVLPKDKYLAALEKIVADQQTQQKAWTEDEKAETNRISANTAALKQLSDAFALDNEETFKRAIATFKTFVNHQQKGLIDNPGLYYANLKHLMNGVNALPDQWNGNDATRFYGEILGVLRESVNQAVIKQVFDAFVTDNKENIDKALETFKQFDKQNMLYSMNEEGCLINSLFNINHIHLIYCAFSELARRFGQLPNGLQGENTNRFYIEFIGGLECGLLPRPRQMLCYPNENDTTVYNGLYYAINKNEKAPRSIDRFGEQYLGKMDSNFKLGVKYFYDSHGNRCLIAAACIVYRHCFKTYYEQLHQHQIIIQPPQPAQAKIASMCALL